jgi:hypothetical protein
MWEGRDGTGVLKMYRIDIEEGYTYSGYVGAANNEGFFMNYRDFYTLVKG